MHETTQRTATRPPPNAGAFRLVVVHSPTGAVGQAVALGLSEVCVGRVPKGSQDLALEDPEVSRAHAAIEPADGGWWVRDLGSRNGTFVDGVKVERRELGDGSILRVGGHLLLFQFVTLADAQRLPVRWPNCSLAGVSFGIERVRAEIEAVAGTEAAALILGETGVGKELVAEEIHRRSGRAGKLVAVNCAALPDELVESELFGHARGAFTGASADSAGLVAEAEGGTLFLDEITEMPMRSQAKLLRLLANGEMRRVGEQRVRRMDVRIVAATNRDPDQAIVEGTFRGDLYARLAARPIPVPPLRARREDVLPLFQHLLARERGASGRLSPDAAEALLVHRWPFNVRELLHVVSTLPGEVAARGAVDLQHLPPKLQAAVLRRLGEAPMGGPIPLALRVPRDRPPAADELAEVLGHFGGNVAQVAAFFGRDRKQIYRWAERLGLDAEAYRVRE